MIQCEVTDTPVTQEYQPVVLQNFVADARRDSVDRIQKMLDRLYDQPNHPSPFEKKGYCRRARERLQ